MRYVVAPSFARPKVLKIVPLLAFKLVFVFDLIVRIRKLLIVETRVNMN